MGLCVSRLYFENGLPSFEQIKIQFKKQTGLDLFIEANVNLIDIPMSYKALVESLYKDLDKIKANKTQDFNMGWEINPKKNLKLNYLNHFQFYNYYFYKIDFFVDEKAIEMQYGIGCHYFVTSLNKTLYDLGGKFVDSENHPIESWENQKKWKKLKHWNSYNWFNRPRR